MAKDYKPSDLLPEFPRTPHLPLDASPGEGDVVADDQAVQDVIEAGLPTWVEEKVDGTNVGICYWKNNFLVRNRREFLRKGQIPKNPSGKQYKPLWNWLYEHQGNFQLLRRLIDFEDDEPISIYGEWLWMAHGVHYTSLPSFFMAFDFYDPVKGKFWDDHGIVRHWLKKAGFEVPHLIWDGKVWSEMHLRQLCDRVSDYTASKYEKQEGIYIRFRHYKTNEPKRYKMVRSDFVPGKYWKEDEIVRNLLRKA